MAENYSKGMAKEAVQQEESFLQKNLKKIIVGVCTVIVVLVAGILLNNWSESKNQKAAEALYPCEQLFQQGQYEKALNGDGQQVIGLLEVAKQYGSTKTGNVAKLYAGLAYAKLDKYEEAKQYLEDFDAKDDEMVSPAALGALGNVYAQLGDNDKAVKTLTKAAEKADNAVLSPIFLVQAAQILESQGNAAEALKLYEEVKANYRGSQLGQEIDKYIQKAKQ